MIASVETDVFALDLAPAAKLGTKSKIAVEPNYIGIPGSVPSSVSGVGSAI